MKITDTLVQVVKARNGPVDLIKDSQKEKFDAFMEKIEVKRPVMGSRSATVKLQKDWLKDCQDYPLGSNYTLVVSSDYNADRARLLAMSIFVNAIQHFNTDQDPLKTMPYWHYIVGGYYDNYRDNKATKTSTPNLLVLDGLTCNTSTDIKIEKARDIIETNYNIPKIVVVTGGCPLEFTYDKLLVKVDRVIKLRAAKMTEI